VIVFDPRPSVAGIFARRRAPENLIFNFEVRGLHAFSRNCPGATERAGNPPVLASQVGDVVIMKLRVVKNIATASKLPVAEAVAEIGRAAIRNPIAISRTPREFEKARTLSI
jgi:hypothetical protein